MQLGQACCVWTEENSSQFSPNFSLFYVGGTQTERYAFRIQQLTLNRCILKLLFFKERHECVGKRRDVGNGQLNGISFNLHGGGRVKGQ